MSSLRQKSRTGLFAKMEDAAARASFRSGRGDKKAAGAGGGGGSGSGGSGAAAEASSSGGAAAAAAAKRVRPGGDQGAATGERGCCCCCSSPTVLPPAGRSAPPSLLQRALVCARNTRFSSLHLSYPDLGVLLGSRARAVAVFEQEGFDKDEFLAEYFK